MAKGYTFNDMFNAFISNEAFMSKWAKELIGHGYLREPFYGRNEKWFRDNFIYALEQEQGFTSLSMCGKLYKALLPELKKVAVDQMIGGEERAIELCEQAIEKDREWLNTNMPGRDWFTGYGLVWAAAMWFAKGMETDGMRTPPGTKGYLINHLASVIEKFFRFNICYDEKLGFYRRIAEIFVDSEEGNRYLTDLVKEGESHKMYPLDEASRMIANDVRKVLNEHYDRQTRRESMLDEKIRKVIDGLF